MSEIEHPSTPINTPGHIGVIMDGNGRWAERREMSRSAGHWAGSRALTRIYQACSQRGIQHLTAYAFSTDNWRRPAEEVRQLMELFAAYAQDRKDDLVARGIRFMTIGNLDDLPSATHHSLRKTQKATCHCTHMQLTMAINYGGRRDLIGATRAIAAHTNTGTLLPDEVDIDTLRRFMSSAQLPDVDLLIRSGGEQRLSDFLLFESAYAELYFTDVLWPDYSAQDLDLAIAHFSRRDRRYGGLSKAKAQSQAPQDTAIAS